MQIEGNFDAIRSGMEAGRVSAGQQAVNRGSRLYEVCQEFEAIFIKQMLNVMRQTVPKGEYLHGGFAEEVFEDMLYDEYAKKMAQNAGFGLSDLLYRQLSGGSEVSVRPEDGLAAYRARF